ncbi:MAG: peptidylprolyl isomerase [Pseudomonadota bacterium]
MRAIVPVVIATVFGFSALAEDDPLIASVNGNEIRLSYVYQQIEGMPLGDQLAVRSQLDQFSESIVREEVLFHYGLGHQLTSDPALRELVKRTIVDYLIEERVQKQLRVSDEEVSLFYQQNVGAIRGDVAKARHILLDQRQQCEALLPTLSDEASFNDAVKAYSKHADSVDNNGEIGPFMNHAGPLGFETKLFEMTPGEMRIFESEDGCHIILVTEIETPPMPPLEKVRPNLEGFLRQRKEAELLRSLLGEAEKHVEVVRPPSR